MAYFTPYLDDNGIHMPTYEERLANLSETYRSIYGNEAELSVAVPDYQLLSVFSKALDDVSALTIKVYNSRNPMYACGESLDTLLPEYGIFRETGESDASVRARIRERLDRNCTDPVGKLEMAVRQVEYNRETKAFLNETDETDANGIPPHSIAMVVDGGGDEEIARAIWEHKPPGISTYGSTTVDVTDEDGNTHPVSFSRAMSRFVFLYVFIRVIEEDNRAVIEASINDAIRDYVNALGINAQLDVPRLYGVAYSANPVIASKYIILDIQAAVAGAETADRKLIPCAWNEELVVIRNAVIFYYN